MSPSSSHRPYWAIALAGVVAVGGAFAVYSTRGDAEDVSCLARDETSEICRFVGGPLEVQGAPVFVSDRPQALFPTRAELSFIDARGETWIAPAKTLTDGASIPAIFSALMGDRQSREYLLAAALHDAYCGIGNEEIATYHTRPWPDVHRMFYEALLVNGTSPKKARVMYAAVYLGGPRWDDPARTLEAVSEVVLAQEMIWCLTWIDAVDPSLEQIEAWMQKREAALRAGTQSEPDWDALLADRA
ncbi:MULTISPECIES: DUF1353 domain-containing protein [unclassified Marinovum]